MALEALLFQQDLFGHSTKDLCNLLTSCGVVFDNIIHEDDDHHLLPTSFLHNQTDPYFDGENTWYSSSSPLPSMAPPSHEVDSTSTAVAVGAPTKRRRRSRTRKNKEEIENQRRTHIAVERNRRKQMNEYLAVLRSLMPESYVQRGDQASIIGGAINFVKELEQRLQFLASHKENTEAAVSAAPFSEFFTFPQYKTGENNVAVTDTTCCSSTASQTRFSLADIEVTMVESHASLKIRSKKRPKLLLKFVSGLQSLRLSILHLNVTTVDQTVLYSLSVKVEDDCKLSSADEIATSVYLLLVRIQEEGL